MAQVLLEQVAPTSLMDLDKEDLIKALDKKLRPSGAGAKTAAAFAGGCPCYSC